MPGLSACSWRGAVAPVVFVCSVFGLSGQGFSDEPPADLVLQLVGSGFNQPVGVTGPGDGSGRLFVVEKAGVIEIVGVGTFLDITARVDSSTNE
ncbi:MAG: hypothetical protein P8127_16310, partial [Acidobacteriota bacterium]